MSKQHIWIALASAVLMAGVSGCEREGPLERAGEEVDEAVDTVRNGEESASDQLDDAADEVREGANDAADEVRND